MRIAYCDGRLDSLNVGFLEENFFSARAKSFYFAFLNVFTLFKLLYPLVHIVVRRSDFGHYEIDFLITRSPDACSPAHEPILN